MKHGYRQQRRTDGYAKAAQVAREVASQFRADALTEEAEIAEREASRLETIRHEIERAER